MNLDAVTNPPLNVLMAVIIVTASITPSPNRPATCRPRNSWGNAESSCAVESRWLMAIAASEHVRNRMPRLASIPRGTSSGERTSSLLAVTHSKALYRNTPKATAWTNDPAP